MNFIITGCAVALFLILLSIMVQVAKPDTAYMVSGLKSRTVIGKTFLRVPLIERVDKLHLALISTDIKTSSAIPTADYININVDAIVNIKISDKPELMKRATQNFLNQKPQYICSVAREVLEGNMREIVGKMKLEEMVNDRQRFSDLVKENASPDLEGMGLEIITFNVQTFTDDQGVINNLGIDNIVRISQSAAISRANAEKEIAIAEAKARQEANDAKIISETEIAKRQNELNIHKAELKKAADIKKAEADAAYQIQSEEQRRTVEITTANANLAKQEKEIELKEREVAIKERTLEATVKKEAEARKYAIQQAADAELYETQKRSEAELFERQRNAEASKYEAEQSAEATKAEAAAKKFAKEQESEAVKLAGLAEAEAIAAKGRAEAEAIKAKAEAEAEGLLKKAEAMKQYGEAAMADMQMEAIKLYFEQLPAIAKAVGEGYNGVDKIVMLGNDSTQLAGNIMSTTTQISEGLSESMGIDLKSILGSFLGTTLANKE